MPGNKAMAMPFGFCDEPFISKQIEVYLFQSKPQIFCSNPKLPILESLSNFFQSKHYGELNANVFCKIYDTAMINDLNTIFHFTTYSRLHDLMWRNMFILHDLQKPFQFGHIIIIIYLAFY